jgi:hypothetical protein
MPNSRTSTSPTATPTRPRRTPKPTRCVDAGSQSAPQLRQKVVKPRARDRMSLKATADHTNRSAGGGNRKSAASSSRKAPPPPRARAPPCSGSQAPPTAAVLSSPSPAPPGPPASFVYLVEVHLEAARLKEDLSNTLIQSSSDQPLHLMIRKVKDWLAEQLPPLHAGWSGSEHGTSARSAHVQRSERAEVQVSGAKRAIHSCSLHCLWSIV